MSNPIPGKQYTIIDGDTLSEISVRAYGTSIYWPRIYRANQTQLRSNNPDLIFPGEIIIIPILQEQRKLRSEINAGDKKNKKYDDLTITVEGREIPYESATVTISMDSAADGCSFRIAWNPGADLDLDLRLKPFTYSSATVHLGNELIINGLLYTVKPSLTKNGLIKECEIYSLTADAIDSTIMQSPYEKNKIKLSVRANELVDPVGIRCVIDESIDSDPLIDRMTAEPTETIVGHIQKFANQFGILVSNTSSGDLLLLKAKKTGIPIDSLEEGFQLPLEWNAVYDGRELFNAYKALGESPGATAKIDVAKNNNVPRSRALTFSANDSTTGSIKSASEWKRSTGLANALTIPIPVSSWYSSKGELWRPNRLLSVKSLVLDLTKGYNFLIRQVDFQSDASGQDSILYLVPPEVYTGDPVPNPWGA